MPTGVAPPSKGRADQLKGDGLMAHTGKVTLLFPIFIIIIIIFFFENVFIIIVERLNNNNNIKIYQDSKFQISNNLTEDQCDRESKF